MDILNLSGLFFLCSVCVFDITITEGIDVRYISFFYISGQAVSLAVLVQVLYYHS